MLKSQFIPLRCFSAYTMLDGAMKPDKMGEYAANLGFPAMAICDRNGLFATMAFDKSCRASGVQPIIGAMLAVRRPDTISAAGLVDGHDWLALYAQNEEGYINLSRLVSASHLGEFAGQDTDQAEGSAPFLSDAGEAVGREKGCGKANKDSAPNNAKNIGHGIANRMKNGKGVLSPLQAGPSVAWDMLVRNNAGLIALTAGADGAISRLAFHGQHKEASAYLAKLHAVFGDRLYMEISRYANPVDKEVECWLLEQAYAQNIPLVATNPAHYTDPAFHTAHDVLTCIARTEYVGSDEHIPPSRHIWLKSAPMMNEIFSDIPEALANSAIIAQRCAYSPPQRAPILPSLAGDKERELTQLCEDALAGLAIRLEQASIVEEEAQKVYYKRAEYELDVIGKMGFPGYFLIVADFIKWAKTQGISVGPGRGSGAGSVVAWALTITDLDPIELGLLFERFLNPARISMPDFDIDFCETRRGEVIRYVQGKYGHAQVAQIITYGTMKARAVIRDVGRVLGMPYGMVDRLTKLIPSHPTDPWTLERSLANIGDLREMVRDDPEVKRLFDLSRQLEGTPRHLSTHAAGVVIGDRPLDELVPLYRDPRSDLPVTQFDMKYVEDAGLVKFDFLGLKTLSILQKAVHMLAERGIKVDLDTLRRDDPNVFKLLQAGDTVGVFQLESDGMRQTLSVVKPSRFADIIALVSLYRPGPMDNIDSFGDRKNGKEKISFPHPLLKDILAETYGIFVYQEQVMQAAQVLAGFSLGEADLLRRAMGKKKKEEMEKQRSRFIEGAAQNAISSTDANQLFDLIDKFAGYGFNKSHAAAYSLLAYQTAWVKVYYPYEFYAASMCFDIHNSDKLSIYREDIRAKGLTILPPDINKSAAMFTVEEGGDGALAVRYGLAGIKNVGSKAIDILTEERKRNGAFRSLADLSSRMDTGAINKRMIENMAAAGTFDTLEPNRAKIMAGTSSIIDAAQRAAKQRLSGQAALFGDQEAENDQLINLPENVQWTPREQVEHEFAAFGYYFAEHPTAHHIGWAKSNGAQTFQKIQEGWSRNNGRGQGDSSVTSSANGGQRINRYDKEAGMRRKMVVLIEELRRREGRRGSSFLLLTLSDQTGRFVARCFDAKVIQQIETLKESGECAFITVDIGHREGDNQPVITIRNAQNIGAEGASHAYGRPLKQMAVALRSVEAVQALHTLLLAQKKGHSEIFVKIANGGVANGRWLTLGRKFTLEEELVQAVKEIKGLEILYFGDASDKSAVTSVTAAEAGTKDERKIYEAIG